MLRILLLVSSTIVLAAQELKKTIINEHPLIYTIDDFISPDEVAHMIGIGQSKLKPALVSGETKGVQSKGRTGSNSWVQHRTDATTLALAQRIADIVGIPLTRAETFQFIWYGVGGEYRQHWDSFKIDGSPKSKRLLGMGGQRLWTALGYLNTVPKAGGTTFPQLKRTVDAEQGRLLVFQNVYNNTRTRHPLAEHAGSPVGEGEKFAFNLWFRECNRKMTDCDILPTLAEYEEGEKRREQEQVESSVKCAGEVCQTPNAHTHDDEL